MIGHTVLEGTSEDADIPAQIEYYLNHEFPCLQNTRFVHNKERREDKIAMWLHDETMEHVEYVLGPVVENFDEVPEEMVSVCLKAGKYAIFETNQDSDVEHLPETIRMFSRCVFYGWIKENRDRVDLNRYTFERYMDKKVYLYVPLYD